MGEIRVQDEQGNIHVFPNGSTPEMISKAMNVKLPQSAPGTVTGEVANINALPSQPQLPFRKYQGPAIDRAESYMGENLQNFADVIRHPINTISSLLNSKTPPIDAAIDRYKTDPAAAAGDIGTSAFFSAIGGKPPGINMAEPPTLPFLRPNSTIPRVAATAGKVAQGTLNDLPIFRQIGRIGKYWDQTAPEMVKPNPKLPLPETPPLELRQASSLYRGPQVATEPSSALGEIPVAPGQAGSMAESVSKPPGKIGGRYVLTPEEAQQAAQIQRIAKQRASARGMQYAAGMKPSGGKVPTP